MKSEVLCTALSARGSEFERDFLEPVGHVGWGNGCYGYTRWWFQTFLIFTPTWGDDPIWLQYIFQIGSKPPTQLATLSLSTSLDVANFTQKKWETSSCKKKKCFLEKTNSKDLNLAPVHIFRFSVFESEFSHNFFSKTLEGVLLVAFFNWKLPLTLQNWNQHNFPDSRLTANLVAIIWSHVCVLNRVFKHACYMFFFSLWRIGVSKMPKWKTFFFLSIRNRWFLSFFFRNKIPTSREDTANKRSLWNILLKIFKKKTKQKKLSTKKKWTLQNFHPPQIGCSQFRPFKIPRTRQSLAPPPRQSLAPPPSAPLDAHPAGLVWWEVSLENMKEKLKGTWWWVKIKNHKIYQNFETIGLLNLILVIDGRYDGISIICVMNKKCCQHSFEGAKPKQLWLKH